MEISVGYKMGILVRDTVYLCILSILTILGDAVEGINGSNSGNLSRKLGYEAPTTIVKYNRLAHWNCAPSRGRPDGRTIGFNGEMMGL
jgi:hypothetical protein